METLQLLQAGRRTAFRFRFEGGMDQRDSEEIESMDSGYVLGPDWPSIVSDSVDIRHRIHYMKRRNLGFGYAGCTDDSFRQELEEVDPRLPKVLGEIVSDLYLNGTRMITDHIENIQAETPRGLYPHGWCRDIVSRLLAHLGKDVDLEKVFVYRVPAGFEGNFEVHGDRVNGFYTELLFGMACEQ